MRKKSEKAQFFQLQVQQAISHTLYELRTYGLAYSTRYDQCLTILHYPLLRVKSKLFPMGKMNAIF